MKSHLEFPKLDAYVACSVKIIRHKKFFPKIEKVCMITKQRWKEKFHCVDSLSRKVKFQSFLFFFPTIWCFYKQKFELRHSETCRKTNLQIHKLPEWINEIVLTRWNLPASNICVGFIYVCVNEIYFLCWLMQLWHNKIVEDKVR